MKMSHLPPYTPQENSPQYVSQECSQLPHQNQVLPPSHTSQNSPQMVIVGPIPSTSTGTTVIVAQNVQYGPVSQNAVCPSCRNQILTRVEAETSTKTHLYAGLLCLVMLWPCICLPYIMDSCKNKNHYCPTCNAYLGTYDN
ncbi:hypothetical protein Trydic_g16367 [Trypoxylus dichotomus]